MAQHYREISGICRLCLCEDDEILIPVTVLLDSSLTVDDVERFTGVRILGKENISCMVCVDCSNKLKKSAAFRASCLKNDELYRQLSDVLLESSAKDAEDTLEQCSRSHSSLFPVSMELDSSKLQDKFSDVVLSQAVTRASDEIDDTSQESHTALLQNNVVIEVLNLMDPGEEYAELPFDETSSYAIMDNELGESVLNSYNALPEMSDSLAPSTSEDVVSHDRSSAEKTATHISSPTEDPNTKENQCHDKLQSNQCSSDSKTTSNAPSTIVETKRSKPKKQRVNYKRCETCGKMVSDLRSHVLTHTKEKKFACPHCPVRMSLNSNLQHHIQNVHLKKSAKVCNLCGESFPSYYAYKYHKNSQHGNRILETECDVCSKKFINVTSYRMHYARYHKSKDEKKQPTRKKRQLCGICGVMVTQMSNHMLIHDQEKQLPCPHCPIKMSDKGNLSRHIHAVHLKKVVRTCEQCNKDFLHINLYKYHMLSMHGIGKTFDCEICLKKFRTLSVLKNHKIALHSNEKKFECTTCGMLFKVKSALKLHEKRVHSSELPYACSQCPKRFKSSYGRKGHEITHSGITFKCDLCDKSYRYKHLLKAHIKKMHTEGDSANSDE